MTKTNWLPISAILLTCLLFLLQHLTTQPPIPKGLDAPANHFSAARAYNVLQSLLRENKPHPVGSNLNREIKERLKNELNQLGITHQEQNTWACASRFASCAEVENLIAIIPGKTGSPYLALMAHYDSVPMSPGAGDDGAGVVAILETARALKLEAPFKHPIMLILTDAEENGLIGAEAFFKQHPLAKEVGIVLNVEGSGSSGSSMVLRTSSSSELLIKSYARESSNPFGFSFVKEIFKRMPNDTDFSVVNRAKISGIDFAFAGERNHYHTPNDNVDNIDLRTIQHHGENILPLSRKLASIDWDDMGDEYVYGGAIYGVWTQWKSRNSLFIWAFSAFLLIAAAIRSNITSRNLLLGIFLSPVTVLLTILSGAAGFYLLSLVAGKVISWPGIDWPYRLLLVGSTAIGGLIATAINRKFVAQPEMISGAWSFWLILTLAVTIFLPDAANTLILPLIFASALLFLATFFSQDSKPIFLLSTLVLTLPLTLGLIFSLEQSQGYKLVWAVLPFIGLYALAISPFLYSLKISSACSYVGAVTIAALLAGSYTNLYTEERPQHVNINYYEDLDSGKSYVQLAGNNDSLSPEPLIEPLAAYVNTVETRALVPFARDYLSRNWAETTASGWKGPSIQKENTAKPQNSVKLTLKSHRSASRLALLLPKESGLQSFHLGSLEFEPVVSSRGMFAGYYVIYLNGVYGESVELTLRFEAENQDVSAYLMDVSTELPPHLARLFNDRSELSSPVHRGDQAILIKEVLI